MAIDSRSRSSSLVLARVLLAKGEHEEGIAELRRRCNLAPENTDLINALAWELMELGRLDDALKEVKSAVELAPEAADPLAYYGEVLERRGDLTEALNQYRRSHAIDPWDPWVRYLLARATLLTGSDLEAALSQAERALKLDLGSASYHRVNGRILRRLGRFGQAAAMLSRANELTPPHHDSKAQFERLAEWATRLAAAEKLALDGEPKHPRDALAHAEVAASRGKMERAVALARAAFERDPSLAKPETGFRLFCPSSRHTFARHAVSAGDLDQALTWLREDLDALVAAHDEKSLESGQFLIHLRHSLLESEAFAAARKSTNPGWVAYWKRLRQKSQSLR